MRSPGRALLLLLLPVLAVCWAHNPAAEHDSPDPHLHPHPAAHPLAPPASPCPQLFRYEPTAGAVGAAGWTGVVRLLAPPRFSALHLMVQFSVSQHLPAEPSPGTLSLRGGVAAGRALVRAAQQGRRKVIEFVADFSCSVTSVPSLLNVTVNGRVFCAAEREPAGTLSTISLVADLETGLEWAAANDGDFSIAPDSVVADKPATPAGGDPATASSSPCSVGVNTPSVGSLPSPTYPVPYMPRDVLRPQMHLLPSAGRAPPAPPTHPRLPPRRPAFDGAHTFPSTPTPSPPSTDPTPAYSQTPPTEGAAVRSDQQSNLLFPEDCGRTSGAVANPLVTRGAAAVRGRWPWLVALFKKLGRRDQVGLNFECGASLLSRRHVVTAAHCVEERVRGRRGRPVDAASLVVYLGKHDLLSYTEPGQQTAEVDAVRMHPEYSRSPSAASFDNDIALLVLSDAVEVNKYTRPVCLWDAGLGTGVDPVVGRVGAVPGWGKDDTGAISNEIRVANMPVVSQETCLRSNVFYHAFTSNTTFCAGFRNGTSVCNGDSGGGLFLQDADGRWRIRGIVSVSMFSVNDQSCDSYNYAVFTDVAQYLPWLHQEMSAAPAR